MNTYRDKSITWYMENFHMTYRQACEQVSWEITKRGKGIRAARRARKGGIFNAFLIWLDWC